MHPRTSERQGSQGGNGEQVDLSAVDTQHHALLSLTPQTH